MMKEEAMKTVITYGTFDLFHEGHYRLLQRAKQQGTYLIVGVTTEYYDASRGKLNVVDSLMERIENVRKTGFADEIIIEDHVGQKIEDIQKYKVDVFVIGSDWLGHFDYLEKYCKVVYLERTKDISSTMMRNQRYNILKIGVVGSGRIAKRFVKESKYVSGINVLGVFNPNVSSAQRFGEIHELKIYTAVLKELFAEVDAIYIASPHETHFEYAKQALLAQKHVICEKPMVLSESEAIELYELAENQGCILFEGIKTAFCPGFIKLLNIVYSGVIGDVYDVEACFTKLEKENNREMLDAKFGGSFLELASYPLLPIFKILGTNYESVCFRSFKNERDVDIYSKAHFEYKNATATVKVGLGVKSEGQLIISGTKGYILVDAPWWKTESFEVKFEDTNLNEKYFEKYKGDGLRYEISEFMSMVNGNKKETFKLSKEETIAMARVMEKYLQFKNKI